jgi:outer membrane murein-binding lipoprotein Lpp
MSKRRPVTVGVAVIFSVIVLAGCGGRPLTHAQFAAKANALCSEYNKKIDVLPEPKNLKEGASMIEETIPIYEKLVSDVKKLNPPAGEAAKVKRVIALGEEQLSLLKNYAKALKAGDRVKATSLQNEGDVNVAKSSRLFHELGIPSCESH